MILKIGRTRKISNVAFCFPHREVNQNLVCSFFPFSFPDLLPMNKAEPADGCHHCCIHKFLKAFRHKLTQSHPTFPSPAIQICFIFLFQTGSLTDLAAHMGVFSKLKLFGLAWPMAQGSSCLGQTCQSVCSHNLKLLQPTNTSHADLPNLKKVEEDMLSCSLCRTHTCGSGFIIPWLPPSKSSVSRVLSPPSSSQFPISKQELPYKGKSG